VSDIYEKAAAQMQQQQGERVTGTAQALGAGYAPPPQGPTAEQALDFLLIRYGTVLEQHIGLRQRVWQLESVNEHGLRHRQDMADMIVALRQKLAEREDELAAAVAGKLAAEVVQGITEKERNALLARCKELTQQLAFTKPVVQATYSWRGRAMSRELRVTAVQALGDGKVRIQVDLRGVSRVGVN
jgi:hypothetical protein